MNGPTGSERRASPASLLPGGGSYLLIDDEYCVNLRGRQRICGRCEAACPVQAVAAGDLALDLKESDCTGCGACVPVCPAGAFRLAVFQPERFLAAIAGKSTAHIHCSASTDSGGGVVVPCHLLLDARLAGAALAGGTRVLALHGLKNCGRCGKGDAHDGLAEMRATLRGWFGDNVPEMREAEGGAEAEAKKDHQDHIHTDRRGFLRLAGLRTVSGAAAGLSFLVPETTAEDDAADQLRAAMPRHRRQRPHPFLEALAHRRADLPWGREARPPWLPRRFEPGCTLCAACSDLCPTGALASVSNPERIAVTFRAERCTACGLCGSVCPPRVVRAETIGIVPASDEEPRELASQALAGCSKCSQTFVVDAADGNGLCPQCRNEREMDDEWFGMMRG